MSKGDIVDLKKLNGREVFKQLWKNIPNEHRNLMKKWIKKSQENKDKRIKVDISISENKIVYRCAKCNWLGGSKRGVILHRTKKKCPPFLHINF